jgi:CheY-like chemotaxis protein
MSRRLLLVDDSDDIRAIARISLERVGGWTVVPAASGHAALDAADSQGPFDAVLLDVMMPDMDGPAVLEELRAGGLAAGVPIVFLTAKTQAAEREHLCALGAAGVIAKPFDPLALSDELGRLLEDRPDRP